MAAVSFPARQTTHGSRKQLATVEHEFDKPSPPARASSFAPVPAPNVHRYAFALSRNSVEAQIAYQSWVTSKDMIFSGLREASWSPFTVPLLWPRKCTLERHERGRKLQYDLHSLLFSTTPDTPPSGRCLANSSSLTSRLSASLKTWPQKWGHVFLGCYWRRRTQIHPSDARLVCSASGTIIEESGQILACAIRRNGLVNRISPNELTLQHEEERPVQESAQEDS